MNNKIFREDDIIKTKDGICALCRQVNEEKSSDKDDINRSGSYIAKAERKYI